MKFFILALVISIASSVYAHAADVNLATDLIAKTIKDAGAISNLNNELKIDLVKGSAEIQDLKTEKLAVTKIDFDRTNGSFTAYISADGNIPFETSGTFTEITKIPVLNRKLSKDEVIAKADIEYLELEPSKIRPEYISNESELIGKASTHGILKSRPITMSQLTEPKVVSKDKQITMVYSNNALKIQTAGIALESGSVGQSIRFKNVTSNRIIMAKIINGDTAEVQSTGSILASN